MNVHKLKRIFDRALDNILTIIFTIMVGAAFAQVIIRFSPISVVWTEEIARTGFIYVTFIGAAVAVRKKEHIVVKSLVDRLSEKTQIYLEILINILILVFTIIVIYGSFLMMARTWHSPTGALSEFGMTIGHRYISLVLGLGLLIFYIVLDTKEIIDLARGKTSKEEVDIRLIDERTSEDTEEASESN